MSIEMGEREVDIKIRLATPDDSAAIAFVLAEAFVEYKSLYTEKGYAATTPPAEEIEKRFGNSLILVAVSGKEIVGTVSTVSQGSDINIRSMAVLPKARGQKIGKELLGYIEDSALEKNYKRLTLSTTPFLDRAIRRYERFGFVRLGVDDLHGTPLITMAKTL
ncbi:MAG: GNAT family N-acetyltransferase [Pyrinomonadaceae bacterium]